ncbi:MAG: hypothetical protein F6J96_13820 [Symploca sp. SIO1C2]|nr:hypothetical protein [Symploca sp. SIO1C2]
MSKRFFLFAVSVIWGSVLPVKAGFTQKLTLPQESLVQTKDSTVRPNPVSRYSLCPHCRDAPWRVSTEISPLAENGSMVTGFGVNLRNLTEKKIALEVALKDSATSGNIFAPYLEQIRDSLPSGWTMRLPSRILSRNSSDEETNQYLVRVFSFRSPPSLTVSLFSCDTGSPSCMVGSFSVDSQTSSTAQQALEQHQAAAPITLAKDTLGYLLEGAKQNPPRSLSSVMWEQDQMIYTVSFLAQERQNLLYMAHSMANTIPIEAMATAEISQTVEENQQLPLSDELVNPDFIPQNTQTIPQQQFASVPLNNNPLSPESFQSQNSVTEEKQDSFPEPPPGEDVEEEDDQFMLSLLRPVPNVRLQLLSSILTNSDIAALSPTENTAFVNVVTLLATPELGAETRLAADVGGSFLRFAEEADGYNSLNIGLGVLQELDNKMSGELGWEHRQLYGTGSFDDLIENSAQFTVRRVDRFSSDLFLDSGYQLKVSFAEPEIQSRVSNALNLSLGSDISPQLQGLLNYRFIYDDFTRQSRLDTRHQVSAQMIYKLDPNIFIGASLSYLFGDSFDLLVGNSRNFNDISIGVNFGVNIPLF